MLKNSLSALKQDAPTNSKLHTGSAEPKPTPKLGRKPKANKAKNPITLKFTDAELAEIEALSGLVPNATYLKNELKGMFKSEQVVSVQSMNAAIGKAAKV